jgi:iron complex transport system permease protein
MLRNPLADSGVLGLSGFAALGAVIAFAFGFAAFAPAHGRRVCACCAALFVTTLGWAARGPASLVLIGVGLSSFAGGLIALALNLAPNPGALADLVNWTLGSVEGRSLEHVALAAALLALGALHLLCRARPAGADIGRRSRCRDRRQSLAHPHLDHPWRRRVHRRRGGCRRHYRLRRRRRAAPCARSAATIPRACWLAERIAGGALLVCADIIVRMLPTDTELKLGVAAALIGGPVFALIAARLASRGGDS